VRYGYFDDEAREYVITRPDTPLPWINYLGSEAFFGIVSNTAGGYSFYRDARLRRLTRCRYNNAPLDLGGRYVYLRDDESGEFWSPSWQPTQRDLEDYSCRHGLGYSIIASGYKGIRAETLYFVPLGENLEVWRIRVTNERPAPARLSLFSSIEWCLWDANDDSTNFQRNYSIGQVEVVDGVIYHKSEYRERRNHFAFFACSAPLAGFDTQRDAFLGPYRGWDRPIVVEQGRATDSIAHGWQPMGSHHVKLDLAPGETREVIVLLGYQENEKNDKFDPPGSQTINKKLVKPIIAHYLQSAVVDKAFEDLRDEWTRQLGILQVQTGNEHIDRLVNIWNPYQCLVTFNMSRSASLFESGIGRGMGFRDSNQDLLGFLHMVPARARERILDIAATQLPTGGAYHQYQPLTKHGNNDIGSGFNDDPAWLVIAAAAYLRETGDLSILDEPVPFDNLAGSEAPLWEHLRRSIDYTLERVGPHGLPLIGRADWNDCLNLNCFSETPGETFQTTTNKEGGVAESVLIGGIFVLAANELAAVAELRGDATEARRLTQAAVSMAKVVETTGWDGEWFRRAYDYYGRAVGSKECDEGQIFIEPQGMCVLAGIGLDNGMAGKALASVRERLATPDGILLQQPPYTYYHVELGEISSFPEGYKENASVFCHTNPWVMIAEARMGNGEGALDYYLRINPSVREAISEVHRCEPFVYAQMISGRDAPVRGEAKNSWLTGTAAWNFVAISQWILGIRAEHDGLRIDPVLPADWEGFTATRRFRGATYAIAVHKPKGVTGRVNRLIIDGREIEGSLLPLPTRPGQSFEIEAFVEKVPVSVT